MEILYCKLRASILCCIIWVFWNYFYHSFFFILNKKLDWEPVQIFFSENSKCNLHWYYNSKATSVIGIFLIFLAKKSVRYQSCLVLDRMILAKFNVVFLASQYQLLYFYTCYTFGGYTFDVLNFKHESC